MRFRIQVKAVNTSLTQLLIVHKCIGQFTLVTEMRITLLGPLLRAILMLITINLDLFLLETLPQSSPQSRAGHPEEAIRHSPMCHVIQEAAEQDKRHWRAHIPSA